MNIKNNVSFINFIKEMVTKRGATINVEEALNILNGDFEYALDSGTLSTQIENMVSSIYTNNAIKQSFSIGGSAVQATSLGLKFRNLEEQQANLTDEAKLLQQELKWIRPDKNTGLIEYAECAMPAWTKEFFGKDGKLLDITNIPDELRQLIAYRIPTEGLHSMMPIKVVKFLPETMGNFILLPYEVTTQFGADFDFDKVYFFGKEFFKDENNEFVPYKYNSEDNLTATRARYYQYSQSVSNRNKMSFDEFEALDIEKQNTRAGRNNNIVDNYLKLLTSLNNLNLIVTPSGFSQLEEFKRKYFYNPNVNNFFKSGTQRDFKERNHIGIALKGQAALHVSGHSYGVLMDLNSTDYLEDGSLDLTKSVNINGKNRTNFSGLYTDNGKLIADELASIMAAILDDIKNPLLEPLGINNNTIDVLATIIRSGVDMNTALLFTSQPGVKHLAKMLSGNKNKIKDRNEGFYQIDTLINSYEKLAKQAISNIDGGKDNPSLLGYITAMYDDSPEVLNIKPEDMVRYIESYRVENDKIYKGHVVEGKDKLKFKKANDEELLEYYSYQVRILKQFKTIESIAKELTKVNKFLAVNKEVGPNIEDILTKKEILEDIQKSNLIKGFDLDSIPSLKSVWKIHEEALSWFEQYFPYSTKEYTDIKKLLLSLQTNKSLYEIPSEERQYINNFIRTFTDYNINTLNQIPAEYDKLLNEVPNLIKDINNPLKAEEKLGNITYNQIRNNLFIQQLKPVLDKQNKTWTLQLKGNRLDLQVKNNVIQSFTALYKNSNTKQLAIDLIKHSFLTTGFFKGINSYAGLINPEIMKELGYNDRKDLIQGFKNETKTIDNKLRLIDQLIRNNPRSYTKTFDAEMFGLNKENKLPNVISTTEALIESNNRSNDMLWKVYTKDGPVMESQMYITVYDKSAKKPELYKKIDDLKYEKTTQLGKNAVILEMNPFEDINKSYLKFNNSKEDVNTNVESIAKPVFDINEFYNTATQEELDYIADIEAKDLQKRIENDLPNLENNCE